MRQMRGLKPQLRGRCANIAHTPPQGAALKIQSAQSRSPTIRVTHLDPSIELGATAGPIAGGDLTFSACHSFPFQ